MRKSKIFTNIGAVLVVVGLLAVGYGVLPGDESDTFTIPGGSEYYYVIETKDIINLEISGDFTVTDGTAVALFVFTPDQYDDFAAGTGTASLYHITAEAAEFSVADEGSSKLFIVFMHAGSYTAQEVSYNLSASGIIIMLVVAGAILMATGAVMVVFALRVKKGEVAAAPPMPQTSDVVRFDEPKPPAP